MIERKIENVLSSTSPSRLFSNESVDPRIFVARGGDMIAYAGDIEAIRAVASLMKVQKGQFDHLVTETLGSTRFMSHNPMSLAYEALALDNPDLDPLVVRSASSILGSHAWAGAQLLAEAMLDRYATVPDDAQWMSDPIVSRLPAEQARAIHDRVVTLASEIWNERKSLRK